MSHDDPEPEQVVLNTWNFKFNSKGVAGGYICPSPTTCGLCQHFLSPSFIYELFTHKFFDVGPVTDLFAWSRASECPLCMYLCVSFVDATDGQIQFDERMVVRWNTTDTAVEGGRRDEVGSWDFHFMSGGMREPGIFKTWSTMLDCWSEENQKMGYYVTTRPANLDIGGPAAFERANSWLDECTHSHPKCQRISPASSELPTRVLEISHVGGDDESLSICLHPNTTKEVAPYAALSYVWGGPQAFRTLQANIASHISQVPLSTLPQTIQDAVLCTHKLGLKYLWVDSLCIIQDSSEDRDREIARMAQIYKNAFVTISAAGARGCHEGFLKTEGRATTEDLIKQSFKIDVATPKDPEVVKEWIEAERSESETTTISWDDPSAWHSQPSTIYLALSPVTPEEGVKSGSLPIKDLLTAHSLTEEVIGSRGWTFQESWLSARTLSYGSSQLVFQCRTHTQSDGGLPPSSSSYDSRDIYLDDTDGRLLAEDGTQVTPEKTKQIYQRAWRKIVQETSRRNLTVAADKLSSIVGIAQEITLQTGYTYLAGLWYETLLHDLSWYQSPASQPAKDTPPLKWTKARHCSSWLWIKTDGPVSFSCAENTSCQIISAEILQQEMEIDPEEPEHEKLSVGGPLRLRAPISTLPLMEMLEHFQIAERGSPHRAFACTIFPDGSMESNPHMCYTYTDTFEGGIQARVEIPPTMRFLELSHGKTDGWQNIAAESRGLVIMPLESGRKGVYRRIGFYVVSLEEDAEWKAKGLTTMMMAPGSGAEDNVVPTAFGLKWKEGLKIEEITIV